MPRRSRVVIAPDKFKGSLSALEVARAVATGLHSTSPTADLVLCPVADGGEGTIDAALAAGFRVRHTTATGPLGTPVAARWARQGDTALIELAEASGLQRLPRGRMDPNGSTSTGVGDMIRAAVDAGCTRVVIGVGGSASTDGGAGMLRALGARLIDAAGSPLVDGGASLARIAHLDLSGLRAAYAGVHFVVACDVDNPLTGAAGAAAVYGPQKGATPADIRSLDSALGVWGREVSRVTGTDLAGVPGAGAAGGVGFAAMAVLGAQMRSGISQVLELVDLESKVVGADLVITGEGSLDTQSLHGKAPIGVAQLAHGHHVATVAVVGRCSLESEVTRAAGLDAVYAVRPLASSAADSMSNAAEFICRLAGQVARRHLPER